MKKFLIIPAVALTTLGLLAGCGGSSDTSTPEGTMKTIVQAFAKPAQAGKACKLYTARYTAEQMKDSDAKTCEEAAVQGAMLAKAFGLDVSDMKVELVKTDGDKATVLVKAMGEETTSEMVRQNGKWLLDHDNE